MKTGTCYFPSYGAALRYYRPYLGAATFLKSRELRMHNQRLRSLVNQKLNAGEIHIGKPDIKPGQRLTIEDNRYHIHE